MCNDEQEAPYRKGEQGAHGSYDWKVLYRFWGSENLFLLL